MDICVVINGNKLTRQTSLEEGGVHIHLFICNKEWPCLFASVHIDRHLTCSIWGGLILGGRVWEPHIWPYIKPEHGLGIAILPP